MSGNNIDSYNIDNSNKKCLISNYNNKNNSINESIGYHLNKMNESELNTISRDNSYNLRKTNNNNSSIKTNHKLKLKLPVNIINNNNYNMSKNNVMINLNTNIISNNLNLQKLKVQQKLAEYHKLIDQKINQLMNKTKRNINLNQNKRKKRAHSTFEKGKSPKNYEIYKKVNISSINSNFQYRPKKKINNISKTNYKYINKEYFKNIHDKNIIMPKKISDINNKKTIINSKSQSNLIKQSNNNKIKILSKDVFEEKKKFNIKNFEDEKSNNKIHEQITSKGNDEEKSEDSKQ